eukprot:17602-Heterococcus_DN1.PRE.2
MNLERKLKKVLDIRTDSPALLVSLEAINVFFENQPAGGSTLARKSLKEDLEKQNYNLSACFLKSIERLKGHLESLEHEVDGLEEGCKSISTRLVTADADMRQFTERAQLLRRQRGDLSKRADQVTEFLHRFQLSEEEEAALGSSSSSSSSSNGYSNAQTSNSGATSVLDTKEGATAFFAALSRLRAVHSECAALVGSQSAGFELLDALSQHLEGAYERLYHWVQSRRVTLASHLVALSRIISMQCGYVAPAVWHDSRVNTQRQKLLCTFMVAAAAICDVVTVVLTQLVQGVISSGSCSSTTTACTARHDITVLQVVASAAALCEEQLCDDESPQLSSDAALQTAVKTLIHRPVYYTHCQYTLESEFAVVVHSSANSITLCYYSVCSLLMLTNIKWQHLQFARSHIQRKPPCCGVTAHACTELCTD